MYFRHCTCMQHAVLGMESLCNAPTSDSWFVFLCRLWRFNTFWMGCSNKQTSRFLELDWSRHRLRMHCVDSCKWALYKRCERVLCAGCSNCSPLLQSIDSEPTGRSRNDSFPAAISDLKPRYTLHLQGFDKMIPVMRRTLEPKPGVTVFVRDRAFFLTFLLLILVASHHLGVEAGCTSRVGRCLGLLGAGTGFQSCAAPPFRATRWFT